MPIEGPLRELGIQDVLQMLDLAQKTGVLTVRSERLMDEAVAHLVDGDIVFASRRRSMRLLGQQMLREGKLTEKELERALDMQQKDPTQRLGAILLEMGTLNPEELQTQLRFQIEETVYDLLSWDEGYFRFEETEATPASPVRVRVDSLLMEGARRIDEWTRLESQIPSSDAVPVLEPGEGRGSLIDLRPDEWEVLAEVDGEKDLRAIASDLGRGVFDVAKIVYGLASMEVVQVQGRRPTKAEQELVPLLDELELMLADGDVEGAESRARELQRDYPERAELALLAGRALVAQGRLRAARDSFEQATTLDPLMADAHYHLGLAAIQLSEFERTVEAWRTYLRLAKAGDRRTFVEDALSKLIALMQVIEEAPRE